MICKKCDDPMDLQYRSPAELWHCAACFLAAYDERKALLAAEERLNDGWDVYRRQGVRVISESDYLKEQR